MRNLAVTFLLIPVFYFQNVIACTVNIEPLRKTYRQSKNIFVGELISIEDANEEELPKELKGFDYLSKLTFKVDKSWKGNKSRVIVFSSPLCDCPKRQYNFIEGEKFLVFADKNSNFDVCNSSNFQISLDKNKNSKEIIKRLDHFGFRLWARFYPF